MRALTLTVMAVILTYDDDVLAKIVEHEVEITNANGSPEMLTKKFPATVTNWLFKAGDAVGDRDVIYGGVPGLMVNVC